MLLLKCACLTYDVRHVDKRDEGQARIAVDDGENLMDRVVRDFIATIITTIGGRTSLSIP
jgi:hypothetical protein